MKPLKLVFIFAALLTPALSSAAPRPLKIGVVFALTGEAAYWSDQQLKGIQIAKQDLAAEGASIELVVEDSGTSAQGSVRAFNKLTEVDKVDAVIGNIWANLTKPLLPLAEQRKVLLVSPERGCEAGMKYSFAGGSPLESLSEVFSVFFRRSPELQRMAILNFDDPGWGHVYRDAWRKEAAAALVREVGHVETAELSPDFKAIVPALLRKKPQAILVAHEPVGSLKALAHVKYRGKIVQSNAIFEALLGRRMSAEELQGVYFADTQAAPEFRSKFMAQFDWPPYLEAHTGYEILRSIAKAAEADPKDLASGLRKVHYDGIAGPIDYRTGCAGNKAKWRLFHFTGAEPVVVP